MTKLATLTKALEPFANAYERLRSYGEDPGDEVPLFANAERTLYELLNTEEGPPLCVGDLKLAKEALETVE